MKILGISAFYHDAAAALVVDGQLLAAAQEERFTRKKHDASFPEHSIAYCLHRGDVGPEGVDAVVYYDKPITTFVRLLKTYLRVGPKGIRSFSSAMPTWTREVVDPVRDRPGTEAHRYEDAEGPLVHRAPREPRRQRVLPVAVRERGDPHLRRRG
jgi:predicted NodU family carbamoyl transferase